MDKNEFYEIPDGGWGWVVVASVALINMTNQSILSVFGLLFGGILNQIDGETITASLITNVNSFALNLSGLFVGPAIKSFQPRSVAALGCMLVSTGLFTCAFATKLWHFIIGYSCLVGLGLGVIGPSTFVAINSYFSAKRGRAVGISMAGTGLGQVVLPHVVRFCLEQYGFQTAILLMSMLSLCGLFGVTLLKPLRSNNINLKNSINLQRINLILYDKHGINEECKEQISTNSNMSNSRINGAPNNENENEKNLCSKMGDRLIQAMDLDLLQSAIFWSMILGMALVYTSTITFTMIFPQFLQYSVNFSTHTTATCMSIMAGADILSRLLLPYLTDKLKVPYRIIFLMGTMGLLISRTALAESTEFHIIVVMSIFTGVAKSATVLNNNLTIADYCGPEKLPSGLGLNMISKGVLVIIAGQLLGWTRDLTNSYILCLHAQNVLLLLVIIVWVPEMWFTYHKVKYPKNNIKDIVS